MFLLGSGEYRIGTRIPWRLERTHYKLESVEPEFSALLDDYGELLFGRRIRLRVLVWAEEHEGVFNQTQAAKGVDYSSSGEVAKELERLVQLGMLRKFGRPSRVGPQNYVRVEDPGWAIAVAARSAVEARIQEADGTDLKTRQV